jgi:hypothetical protein
MRLVQQPAGILFQRARIEPHDDEGIIGGQARGLRETDRALRYQAAIGPIDQDDPGVRLRAGQPGVDLMCFLLRQGMLLRISVERVQP